MRSSAVDPERLLQRMNCLHFSTAVLRFYMLHMKELLHHFCPFSPWSCWLNKTYQRYRNHESSPGCVDLETRTRCFLVYWKAGQGCTASEIEMLSVSVAENVFQPHLMASWQLFLSREDSRKFICGSKSCEICLPDVTGPPTVLIRWEELHSIHAQNWCGTTHHELQPRMFFPFS